MPYDSFLRSWIQAELTFWEIGQYSAVDGHGKKGTGKYTLDNSILSLYTLDSYKVSIENNIMILTNRTKDNRKVIITCVRL
ncbi:MAG: hypothetical protein JWO58_1346 [Chitinophagaceae bacterium]|nr:hypothetical protein [Chitinophagaceae bacterium]